MFVFAASTLILLAKVELLDLFLDGIRLPVAIPLEVQKECCGVKKSLDVLIVRRHSMLPIYLFPYFQS